MVSQSQSLKEFEAHENRIQRLEVQAQDLLTRLVETAVGLKGFEERVALGFENLARKLDDTVGHISEHVKQQQEVVKEILPTVKKFGELQERKDKRINVLRKATWVIMTGVLTLFTEKLCKVIFGG